jgi:lipoprotein-releasing system permease protein
MNSTFFIAKKFSKIKKDDPLYTSIYAVAIFAISFAITALLTISTIMDKVHENLNNELINIYPLITISGDKAYEKISQMGLESNVYKLENFPVILSKRNNESEAIIQTYKGHTDLPSTLSLKEGQIYNLVDNTIILNEIVANDLNVEIGERILLTTGTNISNMKQKLLLVVGITQSNVLFQNIVNNTTFDELLGERKKLTETTIDLENIKNTPFIVEQINKAHPELKTRSWSNISPRLNDAIKFERVAVTTATSILVVMSSFTIFALITAMGIKRSRDISILRLIGVRRKQIFFIFLLQALFIATITSMIAMVCSYILLENMNFILIKVSDLINANISTILGINDDNKIDFALDKFLLVKTLILNFIVSILSALVPSYIRAKMNTGEALKYE